MNLRLWRNAGHLSFLTFSAATTPVIAQTVNVPNGLPQTPIAVYQELGMGGWKPATAGGTTAIGPTGSSNAGNSITPTSSGSALDVMNAQSWGYAAAQNASALGVNPDALAATCEVESQCQSITTHAAGSTITGAFQMSNGTYQEEMGKALQSNPGLAASIGDSGLSGQTDPATQAVAAAQYLKDAALKLQSSGISNPTALDTRAFYNFGGTNGAAVAQADADMTMAAAMPDVSQDTLTQNGIAPGETVGQWRSAVAAQMGTSANAPVLTS